MGQPSSGSGVFSDCRPDCSPCAAVGSILRSASMTGLFEAMRAYPDLLQICGVVGSALYVGGFALVQTGRICGNGPYYSCNQLTAATLVLISLIGAFNLGAFFIQVGFLIFGSIGLVRKLRIRKLGLYPSGTGVIDRVSGGPTEPASPDGWPATCDWEKRRPVLAHDRPVQSCLAGAAPAP